MGSASSMQAGDEYLVRRVEPGVGEIFFLAASSMYAEADFQVRRVEPEVGEATFFLAEALGVRAVRGRACAERDDDAGGGVRDEATSG